jgi:hypothetical protein
VVLDIVPNDGAGGVPKFAGIRVSTGRCIYPEEKALHQEVMHGLNVYDATWVLFGEAGLDVEALLHYLNSSTAYRLNSDSWRRVVCARTTASIWRRCRKNFGSILGPSGWNCFLIYVCDVCYKNSVKENRSRRKGFAV